MTTTKDTLVMDVFHNPLSNMTAMIVPNLDNRGGYNVTLRDNDSGQYLPARTGFKTLYLAQQYAEHVVKDW